MVDITASLAGSQVFSKLDLKKGYPPVSWIPVHPAHRRKTAVITPFGRFILPFTLVYLDDILVASPDRRSHAGHLRQVLERLRDNGLVLNLDKCQFFQSAVNFLGLRMSAAGVAPLPSQLAAIKTFPRPGTVKELQGFLVAVKFNQHFLPAAATILLPLTEAL